MKPAWATVTPHLQIGTSRHVTSQTPTFGLGIPALAGPILLIVCLMLHKAGFTCVSNRPQKIYRSNSTESSEPVSYISVRSLSQPIHRRTPTQDMPTMFHPYRRSSNSNKAGHLSATRSTLRPNDGAEDDELLYLQETASSTAQAFPVLNPSKRGSSMKTPGPPSTSSNKTSTTESVVAAKQETEEITIQALDVIDEDDSEDNNSTAASPTHSNVVSYQSGPSRHRRPRVSRTQASGTVPDLGAAGCSNTSYSTPSSSSIEITGRGGNTQLGLIRTHHAIPRPLPPAMPSPYAVCFSVTLSPR